MPLRSFLISRRLAHVICFSAIICIVGGCDLSRSVNPFYRPQDVVFDTNLLGDWQSADSSERANLVIKAQTADSYTIEWTQYDKEKKSEASWTFEAHLFSYQKDSYLDLFPIAFRVRGKKENFRRKRTYLSIWFPCIP
jgi:hypothetical protein